MVKVTGFVLSFLLVSSACLRTVTAQTLEIAQSPVELSDIDRAALKAFVDQVFTQLPERMKYQLAPDRFPVVVQFSQLDGNVSLPNPECPAVEDMGPAKKVREEFRRVAKSYGSMKIRYDGAVHTAVEWDKRRKLFVVKLHTAFIPIILNGKTSVWAKACSGWSWPEIAHAALVHGFSRAFDLTRFNSKAEADYVSNSNEPCFNFEPSRASNSNKMLWNDAELECWDLKESRTLISEKKRYRVVSGGWGGDPGSYDRSFFAIWPRAVNTYAYAGDVQTHFAYHMERFLLDPEFACRMPVIHEYLSSQFQDPFNAVATGVCSVNTILRLTPIIGNEDGSKSVALEEYDLNPENVSNVYYYRAGAGDDGIASAFGHSMYRLEAKKGSQFARGGCPDEEFGLSCDLIFNHRATSRELRLDNGAAAFGAYPSQLLISTIYDIRQEYGDQDLRELYNVPLGRMTDKGFVPMEMAEKTRFIYAGLEQYWTYLGRYKFLTNNCADEAMRLFSIGSDHPGVQYAGILTPSDINEGVFEKLGFTDPTLFVNIREQGFFGKLLRKLKFWDGWVGGPQKRYEKRRQAIENHKWVHHSRRYPLYDSASMVLEIENKLATPDRQRDPKNVKNIEREVKSWVKLATVSENKGDVCKINEGLATSQDKLDLAERRIQEFRARYLALMDPLAKQYAATKSEEVWQDMYDLNRAFYMGLYYADKRRQKGIGELAVQIAYEIGVPDGKRPALCDGDLKWQVQPEKAKMVHTLIEDYRRLEMNLQPYSSASIRRGYGIPLEKEMTKGHVLTLMANAQVQRQRDLIMALQGELGVDYALWYKIKQFRRDLCEERIQKNLIKNEAPNCRAIFPEIYAAEEILAKQKK